MALVSWLDVGYLIIKVENPPNHGRERYTERKLRSVTSANHPNTLRTLVCGALWVFGGENRDCDHPHPALSQKTERELN